MISFNIKNTEFSISPWVFPLAYAFYSLCGYGQYSSVMGFGLIMLVIGHELGHAAAVLVSGGIVKKIEVRLTRGLCYFDGVFNKKQHLLIYSAGIIAQLVMFFSSVVFLRHFSLVLDPALALSIRQVFIDTNLIMAAVNLIPLFNSDGSNIFKALLRSNG